MGASGVGDFRDCHAVSLMISPFRLLAGSFCVSTLFTDCLGPKCRLSFVGSLIYASVILHRHRRAKQHQRHARWRLSSSFNPNNPNNPNNQKDRSDFSSSSTTNNDLSSPGTTVVPGSAEAPPDNTVYNNNNNYNGGGQRGATKQTILHGQFYSELGDDELLELEDGNGNGNGNAGSYVVAGRDEKGRVPTQWYQEMEGDAGKVYELGDHDNGGGGAGGSGKGRKSVRHSKADQILGR